MEKEDKHPHNRIIKRKKPWKQGFQGYFVAPRTGLEPVTSWLTVMRSTDWAKEEYEDSDLKSASFFYITPHNSLV